MSDHISIRDVEFTPSTKGVRIIVTTDVPCVLFCRLTEQEPWIHKKPSLRRGVQFAEDVRFCFTVYEDNQQYEADAGLIHTFWKENWPPCTTKWCYFWGTIGGAASVSTSPFFKYHNDGVSPVPVPDVMDVFNSIEPQLISPYAAGTWQPYDCSHFVHETATGVILWIRNKSTTAQKYWGARMKGQAFTQYDNFIYKGQQWAVIGLDADKQFEALSFHLGFFEVWAMGYTGQQVKFLAEPVEISATVNDVWQTKDLSAICPSAIAALGMGTQLGAVGGKIDIRKLGSTDDRYTAHRWICPFIPLDDFQKCEVKQADVEADRQHLFVTGYITTGLYDYTNAQQLPNWGVGSWHEQRVDYTMPAPKWAVLNVFGPGATLFGARKKNSLRDLKYNENYRLYIYIHCDSAYKIEYYRGHAVQTQFLLAEVG